DELGQANALDQLTKPLMLRLAGPAVGGVLISLVGVGSALALDAVSFGASITALLLMKPVRHALAEGGGSVGRGLRAGWAFLRRHVWLWATFASAAIAYLLFMGPAEVLLPFMVKNELHGGAGQLGAVFAAGGIGSVGCAVILGQRGLPRRDITFMY